MLVGCRAWRWQRAALPVTVNTKHAPVLTRTIIPDSGLNLIQHLAVTLPRSRRWLAQLPCLTATGLTTPPCPFGLPRMIHTVVPPLLPLPHGLHGTGQHTARFTFHPHGSMIITTDSFCRTTFTAPLVLDRYYQTRCIQHYWTQLPLRACLTDWPLNQRSLWMDIPD